MSCCCLFSFPHHRTELARPGSGYFVCIGYSDVYVFRNVFLRRSQQFLLVGIRIAIALYHYEFYALILSKHHLCLRNGLHVFEEEGGKAGGQLGAVLQQEVFIISSLDAYDSFLTFPLLYDGDVARVISDERKGGVGYVCADYAATCKSFELSLV